jgi:CheY-like chemotaxis protein
MANAAQLKTQSRKTYRPKISRILCVDDDASVCETMSLILRLRGYETHSATSGIFALQALRDSDFDLVITDLSMPGMDGIEFIRRLRKLKPSQRIIVVTGFPSVRTEGQAFKLGTLNYIAKPVSSTRLLEVVEECLKDEEEGLIGSLQLSFEELIQLYGFGQKTGVLEIHCENAVGYIYMKRGNPVHAAAGELKGEDAFFEILSWKTGIFVVEGYNSNGVPHTITRCVESLLLEGAKRRDECRHFGISCRI